jgi:hypothetical protein
MAVATANRMPLWEAFIGRDLAALEARHGSVESALSALRAAVDMHHRNGDAANLSTTLVYLAVLFDRIELPDVAATLYGTASGHGAIGMVVGLADLLDRLRAVLGSEAFDAAVASGEAMTLTDAVPYARREIERAGRER